MARSLNSGKKAAYSGGERRVGKVRTSGRMAVGESGSEADRAKQPPRTSGMSFRLVLFMILMIAGMTKALIFYIKLQSDVTSTSREIAELEKELTEKKAQNDAAYNEINDSISLEEVRKRAIEDLGMKSADRDQVVIYSGEEQDSVNQVRGLDED